MPNFGDYQLQIYGAGLQGVIPKLPVDFATLVQRAQAAMPPQVLTYIQGGCGDEWTQDSNVAAFHRCGMVPRMMVDSSTRDLSVELFGCRFPTPLFMAPIGVNGICTQDGHGDLHAAQPNARNAAHPSTMRRQGRQTANPARRIFGNCDLSRGREDGEHLRICLATPRKPH